MKPPMRQKVTAYMPVLGDDGKPIRDKYSKPKTKPIDSKARVQFKSQLVRDANGRERRVSLEIDLPSDFNPGQGIELDYVTVEGDTGRGTIVAKDETTNIAGNKVYYRTVYVDG
ncbi:hypothetical protein ACFSMW_13510 [Virgibacillus halophilus]|uniref:Uncharacterized protein n=1 Tax=Tigheibacillus halophilus TaxID=361280 RepID=A0ABU5CA48_9BACI|nr:hypothetical protein [Virgibacillus halophilus]